MKQTQLVICFAGIVLAISSGKATMENNDAVLKQLASTMVKFDPWFEILPGTRKKPEEMAGKKELFRDEAPVGQAAAYGD